MVSRDKTIGTQVALGVGTASLAFLTFRWLKSRLESKKPFEDLDMPPNSHWLLGHVTKLFDSDFDELNQELSVRHANSEGFYGILAF